MKAALVDLLHCHFHSMEETGTNNLHVADTSDSQTHVPSQGNGDSGLHVDTSNSKGNVLAQGSGASGLQVNNISTSQRNPSSQGNSINNPQATVTPTPTSTKMHYHNNSLTN